MAYWKTKNAATPIKQLWGGAMSALGAAKELGENRNPIEEKINREVKRKVDEATGGPETGQPII